MRYHNKKIDNIGYHRKKTDSMYYHRKKKDNMCYHGKKANNLCYHKQTDNMCYHGKKTDSIMCYHGKNTFLVPFSFKIVRRFPMAYISHLTDNMKSSSKNRKIIYVLS